MQQMNDQWFWAAIIGFLIGGFIVWLFMRSGRNKSNEDFSALQKEYKQYREDVNAHFAKTADAVDNLTESYKDVFTHLSEGAEHLMDEKALQAQLEKRQGKAVTLAYLVDEQDIKSNKSTSITQDSVVEHKVTASQTSKESTPISNSTNNAKSSQTIGQKDSSKVSDAKDDKQAAKQASEAVHLSTTGQSVKLDKTNKTANDAKPQTESQKSAKQAVAEKNKQQTSQNTSPITKNSAEKKKESIEKTPAQEAALKAGLSPLSPFEKQDSDESAIETVKRHLRENNKPS